jgi:hypothetical protein
MGIRFRKKSNYRHTSYFPGHCLDSGILKHQDIGSGYAMSTK